MLVSDASGENKLVIVVRMDLKMGKGKIGAQVITNDIHIQFFT